MQINKVKASLNNYRQSPYKVREITGLIVGKAINEAEVILQGINKSGSQELRKLLKSAVANAQNNFNLNKDVLYISEIRVNEAPVMKRFRARAFGRAAQILKRSCHINIVLESISGEEKTQEDNKGKKLERPEAVNKKGGNGIKNQKRTSQKKEIEKSSKDR